MMMRVLGHTHTHSYFKNISTHSLRGNWNWKHVLVGWHAECVAPSSPSMFSLCLSLLRPWHQLKLKTCGGGQRRIFLDATTPNTVDMLCSFTFVPLHYLQHRASVVRLLFSTSWLGAKKGGGKVGNIICELSNAVCMTNPTRIGKILRKNFIFWLS